MANQSRKHLSAGIAQGLGVLFVSVLALVFLACGGSGGGGTNPPSTYTVTYDANGSTSGSVPTDSGNYQQNQTVTVLGNTDNLARTNFSFAGWNTQANGTGTTYTQGQTFAMGAANITLYALWTANPTYTVTYSSNGSTGGSVPEDSTNYEQGQTVTVLGNTGGLTRTNYTFAGWNIQANGAGTTYTQGQTFAMGSSNITLYATWTANPTYTVTYSSNGSTGGSVPTDSTNYEQGQTVTVLGNTGNLVRAYSSFSGWNTRADGTGTTYTQGQTFAMGSSNVTLYARWTANPTYTVTYSSNLGSGGSVPTDSTRYEAGQTVTVLGNTGNLVKIGYAFAGWNTSPLGTGVFYSSGSTFIMGSANVTLYVYWATAYSVTYLAYPTTVGGSAPVDSRFYLPGQTVTVLGNTGGLTNPPFTFANWNTQPNQSGTSYGPGSTFTMGASDVILYSQWGGCVTYENLTADVTVLRSNCNVRFSASVLSGLQSLATPAGDCELTLSGWIFSTVKEPSRTVTWASENSFTDDEGYWVFQSDGNLVWYDDINQADWASGTNGNPGATLSVTPALNGCGIIIWNSANKVIFEAP